MIIDNNRRVFLIKFLYGSTNHKFLFNEPKDLKHILETYINNGGVEYIKEFDSSKNRFVRVSKQSIRNWCSWQTEVDLFLDTHYHFKK